MRYSHRDYQRHWALANAAAHLPVPRPAFSGQGGVHKYLTYDVSTFTRDFVVPAGQRALIFWDDVDQVAVAATGAWLTAKLAEAADYRLEELIKDRDDLRAADFVRSAPNPSQMMVRGLLGNFLQGSGSNLDLPSALDSTEGNDLRDQFPLVQRMHAALRTSVNVPFGGSATVSIVAPGLDANFCGDSTRRVYKHSESRAATDYEPTPGLSINDVRGDPDFRNTHRMPNMINSGNWEGNHNSFGKVIVQMGASSSASMTHHAALQPSDAWHLAGRFHNFSSLRADNPSNTMQARRGAATSNMLYQALQGSVLIKNTGSDPVTVTFSGRAVYAVSRFTEFVAPEGWGSDWFVGNNALAQQLLRGASTLQTVPRTQTGDAPLHKSEFGSSPTRPPGQPNVQVPKENDLAESAEQAAGAVGIMTAAKAAKESSFFAKAATFAEESAAKVGGFLSRYAGDAEAIGSRALVLI